MLRSEKAVAPAVFPVLKKTTEIYAVYSPLGRCLKTSFALTLGQILAKERAVLYLNLEEYSGFEEMLGKGFAQNLSDLLYFVRQENGNLIYKMNSMVQTIKQSGFHSACTYARGHTRNCMGRLGKTDTGDCTSQ